MPNPPQRRTPTPEEAVHRVRTLPAIDLTDLAALLGVSLSTVNRQARDEALPVPCFRIGQRWCVPSAPVAALLHLGDLAAV
ncbi:hypothetical protein BST28_17570 [Mycolicibacter kumamotonensis]|uniref:Helix-turn-helix domain-containing protein n=1 Tax=Mycolicibacter kumamotonensis TaxID=354243 RepID=A0A1X0DZA0_9MYCO|nr:hypothetical protein BST28_17570 [Mycolicibacter kumamotonensis]